MGWGNSPEGQWEKLLGSSVSRCFGYLDPDLIQYVCTESAEMDEMGKKTATKVHRNTLFGRRPISSPKLLLHALAIAG